jgi:class 3 adenylate cyclase/DNA-binding response OmpR family regulator
LVDFSTVCLHIAIYNLFNKLYNGGGELKLAGEMILIVDDAVDNRAFIRQYVIEPNGYRAIEASNGRAGLEMAVKHKPDLILLDYNMPIMDGSDVLRALRKHHIDIPVILMTFHGSEDVAVEVFRLGVRDYISKPFYPEDMENAIDRSLTETRLRREKEALTKRLVHVNHELQHRFQELNVLHGVGKNVTSLLDMDQLMPHVVKAAIQLTHAEVASIYLVRGDQVLRCAVYDGRRGEVSVEHKVVRNRIVQQVIASGQTVVLDEQEIRRFRKSVAVSAAYVPLVLGREIIGVLGVENHKEGSRVFTQHDSALLSALSDYVSIAIANSRNYEALGIEKEQEKEQIRGTFERFAPPSIVERVLDQPESLQLGGIRQEISVLFADIRGYTSWSENAAPELVVETLNHYLSIAAEVILSWEGTLDKFFGDGLMAIFNAPNKQTDHVHRAADAALALMKAADEVSSLYGHRLTYSVGVSVGEAVVGYIGTDRAVNYTAIGDTVNLAKRLQENAAPGQILVEETTIHRLGTLIQARPLGDVQVKGRQQPAFVYELQGLLYPQVQ